jgi:hypothetical protein
MRETRDHLLEAMATGMTAGGQSFPGLSLLLRGAANGRLGTVLRGIIQMCHICRKQTVGEADWRVSSPAASNPYQMQTSKD